MRAWPAGGERRLAEAVERLSLTRPVAGLAVQGQGLPLMIGGLLVAPVSQVDITEAGKGIGFAGPVAAVAEQDQGLLVVVAGLLIKALP